MVMAVPLTLASSHPASADQFDQQKAAIQNQIDQYQAQAAQLSKQANTLQSQLKLLQTQRDEIQAQLDLTQKQYDQLTSQIATTENQIKSNQAALGQVMATMWVSGGATPLEMLASSKNIGDFIDQQALQNTMQNTLNQKIKRIKTLKSTLQKQQAKVQLTLNRQTAQKNSLVAKEQQQAELIAQTQNQESAYQQLVSQAQQHLQQVSAQQRAFFASMSSAGVVGDFSYSNWSGNQGCAGGYPYCGTQDSTTDPWGLYNRECVSYVAWSLAMRFHRYVANFNGQGNAYEWPQTAVEYSGAQVVQNPQPGDAVILPATSNNFAPIGHAMIVESVNGSSVNVSQYNFGGTGEYSTMTIGTGGVIFLRFPVQ